MESAKYLVHGKVMGEEGDSEVDLIVNGDVVTGTVTVMGERVAIEDGIADGNTFKCKSQIPTPMGQMRIKMTGEIENDILTLTIKNPMGNLFSLAVK